MNYMHLVYIHLATVTPAILIGSYLLLNHKGTSSHKRLGRIYMGLMLATALTTLILPAHVGPVVFGHFGFIHLLCLVVFASVAGALLAVRRGNIKAHRNCMIGLYLGGIVVAGSFTLMPGRLVHGWLFG